MSDIEEIVDRLKNYTTLKNERDIADLLGITPSDFSNRKKRGTLLPLIVGWCLGQQGINMEWVLRGRNVQVAEGNNNVQVGGGIGGGVTIGGASATQGSSLSEIEEVKALLRYAPIDYLMEIKEILLKYKGIRDGK